MEVMHKFNELDCNRCGFHGSDYKSVQIHMGTIHPEFCEEIDTAGLGKLVFYQKSARLFHCHRCFFTSKMFSSVYYHILDRHAAPDKWSSVTKPMVEPKSEAVSVAGSDKNDSESVISEDEKSIDEQDQKDKLHEVVKSEENDTLTSWPEKMPSQDNQGFSDSEFKSRSLEKASVVSPEAKESSSDPDLPESESSSNISKANSVQAKVGMEFSDDAASSPSKDIPEFSDEDEEPALPGGIPHFSEDEETVTPTKHVVESPDAQMLADQSRGIEDISEDEMPPDEITDNVSEDDRALAQSKEPEDSSEEEEALAPVKEMMEFSEDEEEDTPVLPKDIMEFSEDEEEEPTNLPKNIVDFSEEEETTNVSKNMDLSEEDETTNATKNIMEFSEEEETPGLSKDIMEFSEDEDTPAMPKSIMEFSEEEDISPQSKNMPKYLEGNSTPTQSKDSEYVEEADASTIKGTSPISEEDGIADEGTSIPSKETIDSSKGVLQLSEYASNQDGPDPLGSGDLSLSAPDALDALDDKDAFLKDEEILKHVKRVKGRFHCLLCDCRPLKRRPILHHLITRHNMPSPFVCKTCGKTFVMETHLKNHLSSHTKGLFKCHRCNFQTDHARGFKKHQTHCESRHKDDPNKSVLDFQEDDNEGD
ncbi:chromosome alignment-maintaining phosphoprotein 1 [Pseudophryne corroboree]|uniref:chromosome alignment-maintaining phosphoprotein 1 n=1 Tax=Pseudophryne corroboree TaxID=495146 RepID=UPI0030817DBB